MAITFIGLAMLITSSYSLAGIKRVDWLIAVIPYKSTNVGKFVVLGSDLFLSTISLYIVNEMWKNLFCYMHILVTGMIFL